ncbi:Cytochrome c7 [Geoglobus ahangari]|uniref:Cytochrome c7 n=1 Tax=Geoglobus ahangari TaxID=113653 RepID=A0A0F7DC34_9EURY|nr:hypothetical protein [Geoglobus ahangari]AKG92146.1 Cytochrome c7 [Geoglobus ahangari]
MVSAGKIFLIIIGVFAVGLIALPSTISLFAGQHYWYDVNPGGNQIPCEKCHADVLEELSRGIYHIKQKGDPYSADGQDCTFCHRVNSSITYAKGDGAGTWVGKEAHAATNIQCLYCHAPSLYGAPRAGGFGLTNDSTDTGALAAHREFVLEARGITLLLGENEACIACHTQIELNYNYTTVRSMGVTIEESYASDGTGVTQSWTFSPASNITYAINSADRTAKGTYEVVR